MNIHSGIEDNDKKLPAAERISGHTLSPSACQAGPCKVWDWSSIPQAESNFSLQQSFERQGVAFWWLDWCCDDSVVSMPGVTPDSWIGHLYAQQMADSGAAGLRAGPDRCSNDDPEQVYPAGAWSDHTSAIAFTGDAWGTWNTLAQEAELTPAEASIGEPYVSDDIGSFLGPPPTQSGADPPDLYDRWVQLGTFQPILRLHSDNEDRLPWQYPRTGALRHRGRSSGFGRPSSPTPTRWRPRPTRPACPWTARSISTTQSSTGRLRQPDGVPLRARCVGCPGDHAGRRGHDNVWFPPGRWVDYFTGATFTGPSTTALGTPLDRMPVFVRTGGIIPEETTVSGTPGAAGTTTLKVYPGSDGSLRLYDDAGIGLGYTKGQDSQTPITLSSGPPDATGGRSFTRVIIGPVHGHYPGQASAANYRVELVDLTPPSRVTLDGKAASEGRGERSRPSWSYDRSTDTLTLITGRHPVSAPLSVEETGARLVSPGEPTNVTSS